MNEAPHVGTVLAGRYELLRHVARGGMGDVYEAEDRVLQRRVAVKLFRATAPADRTRFDAEVRVLASLNHPGIVPVFDAGSVGDDAFVVLELIDGPPLRARMADGPLPAGEVAELGARLAEALAYIHDRGVVHRDVTPSNVLCSEGRPRLVDFGIARLLDAPRVTSPDLTIGTAAYMAPEQVQGKDVSGAADVYSLGLLLLEALTGHKAFPGPSKESFVVRLARDPDTTTGVPGAWRPLLAAMTARDPMARPPAAQVQARLVALAGAAEQRTGMAPIAVPARVPRAAPFPVRRSRARATDHRRPAPLWALGAAAAAVLVAVVLLWGSGHGGSPGDPVDAATTSSTEALEVAATGGPERDAARSAQRAEAAPTTEPTAVTAADDPTTPTDPDALRQPGPSRTAPPSTAPPTTTATTEPAPTTTAAPPTTSPPTTDAPAA